MSNLSRMNLTTILMYLCIPLFVDGGYFIGFHDSQPECGLISLVFFNISFICLFLPALFCDKRDEKNQTSSLNLVCVTYLIIEIILAAWFISHDAESMTAGVTQGVVCGIFFICFLGLARANVYTNLSLQEARVNRSMPLLEVNATLRQALAETQELQKREYIREALAEIGSVPIQSHPQLESIDNEIRGLAVKISENPTEDSVKLFSRILQRRRTMLMLIQ